MKAIEFQTRLNRDQTVTLPPEVAAQVPAGAPVRVLLLYDQSAEEADWRRLTMEQFLKGYSEDDAVYDELPAG
jgi:hypothetical protein